MAGEHDQLVDEMPVVAALPLEDRLQLARQRRLDQLMHYQRREEACSSGSSSSSSSSSGSSSATMKPANDSQAIADTGRRSTKGSAKVRRAIKFSTDVMLMEAAKRNDITEVRSLLETNGADPNATNVDGLTVLHQCCADGYEELIRVLLTEFGADVNCADDERWTPLHTAALGRKPNVCRLLIHHGADLLAMTIDGNMPYDVCDDEEALDVIESAMAGRSVTQEMIESLRGTKEQRMLADLRLLLVEGRDLEFRGQHGETPLHTAAANGYMLVAELLLTEGGVSVDVVDSEGWQPLHCAAHWRQLAVLELLMIHGAGLDALTNDQQTPSDLIEDESLRQWMLTVKSELEMDSLETTAEDLALRVVSNSRINSSMHSLNGSVYSSNISLADKASLSALARHQSSKDKAELSRAEARSEARLRQDGPSPLATSEGRQYHSAPSLLDIPEAASLEEADESRTPNCDVIEANVISPRDVTGKASCGADRDSVKSSQGKPMCDTACDVTHPVKLPVVGSSSSDAIGDVITIVQTTVVKLPKTNVARDVIVLPSISAKDFLDKEELVFSARLSEVAISEIDKLVTKPKRKRNKNTLVEGESAAAGTEISAKNGDEITKDLTGIISSGAMFRNEQNCADVIENGLEDMTLHSDVSRNKPCLSAHSIAVTNLKIRMHKDAEKENPASDNAQKCKKSNENEHFDNGSPLQRRTKRMPKSFRYDCCSAM